ncbi:MAG: hypothetical protein JWO58_1433 [Chitinophagaceae bacterium]|nr:hypothetical protein [Chitinophagaceae bacterium]
MQFLKKIFIIIGCIFLLIPLYLAVALLFSYIPYNTDFTSEAEHPIQIQLHSNGVHTDFILPITNEYYNWHALLPEIPTNDSLIAFGWGDKGFYLNTPNWSDLKLSTAFNAGFGLSTTAMHVSYSTRYLSNSKNTVTIWINAQQYKILCEYIQSAFQNNVEGKVILIPHDPRYYAGHFYDAKGTYSIFTSCNSWINKGLKKSGIKTCLWTPFDWPLLKVYQ